MSTGSATDTLHRLAEHGSPRGAHAVLNAATESAHARGVGDRRSPLARQRTLLRVALVAIVAVVGVGVVLIGQRSTHSPESVTPASPSTPGATEDPGAVIDQGPSGGNVTLPPAEEPTVLTLEQRLAAVDAEGFEEPMRTRALLATRLDDRIGPSSDDPRITGRIAFAINGTGIFVAVESEESIDATRTIVEDVIAEMLAEHPELADFGDLTFEVRDFNVIVDTPRTTP
jgi:hypothetical protein